MEKIYHNFAGMDLDTSPEKFNPNYYSTAYNVRIGSNIGSLPSEGTDNKKGSLEGLKGINATLSGLFTDTDCKIIALTKIRDNVVFILSTSTTQSIYNILESDLKNSTTPTSFFTWNKSSLTLNEDTTTILGRYETDKLIKVYITDGDTYLKSINLSATAPTDIKQLEVFKPVEINSSPSFTVTTGGSLKAGNIAYGIQYYSLNGSASNYIPVGPLLPILRGDINDSKVLVGGTLNEVTDKATSITIPYVPSSSGFNYAKVVRIHYTILGEVPSITVVYDGAISNTLDTVITDSGQFIESVTPEEYALITNPFKCKTIEQKNNILFAGNILQQEFDVDYDARIRRYNSLGSAYSGDLNPYNDSTKTTFTDGEKYTYASDGHTVGGSGVNGVYNVFRTNIPVYNTIDKKPVYTTNIYKRSLQRGEIYGFALVGFDEYMRPSFAKFIDDIKIPGYNERIEDRLETARALNTTISNVIHQEAVYINFGFNNLPSSVKYCAIVRTSREGGDGCITDMGIATPLRDYEGNTPGVLFCPVSNIAGQSTLRVNSESIQSFYEVITPKALVNKSLPNFDAVHYFVSGGNDLSTGPYTVLNYQEDSALNEAVYKTETLIASNTITNSGRVTLLDKKYYPYNTNKDSLFQIGSKTVKSATTLVGDTHTGFKGTCVLINTQSTITPVTSDVLFPPMVCLVKNTYPYGGSTPQAIEQRNWILSSPITRVVDGSVTLTTNGWGDTYSQIATNPRILIDVVGADFPKDMGNTVYIPFESQVLLKGIVGKTFENYFTSGVSVLTQPFRLMQESKGVWTNVTSDPTLNSFTQENDLYGYNSAYSTDNKSKVYITKPSIYVPQNTFDCTVINSDRKINGELIDSWTIFRPNNKIELDTSRGSLTSLVNLNNTLFFIQESGAGTLAVDERELIPSSNTGSLYLGTGGVLTRFDYIFTNYGAKNQHSIDSTNSYIYFYDSASGKFCRMNTQQVDIMSDTMSCKSYFSKLLYSLPQNPDRQYYIGADNIKQELYLKPSDGNGIVFNELWNSFSSLTTIPFNRIFTTKDIMYFTIPYNTALSPFTGNGGYLYSLASYSNMDVTNEHANDLEYSLDKSVEFISSGQVPMRLDLVEWTSKNYTPLSNTDIEEKYEIYEEDIMFKEFTDSNSNPNPRFFNKKRYNQIYNVNNRQRCKGNYFKIKYIGNYDKLKKSNFTLNSFNVYITPLLNR